MDTVSLTIDGRPLLSRREKPSCRPRSKRASLFRTTAYHPGISIDGSCRVCVVKIEKMPKLQTSCSTACTDGMVVLTRDPDVVQARGGRIRFLLVNHPLDCPVCDKGGECPLQDFSYTFGPAESRMDFPRRVFDGEGVKADVDFGPTLMLNRNRCILCTRCVRFMKEIDADAQINIVDRGYGSEIATFQEQGVHSLISGNLMDVCPVGAITTRDYRFKSRPVGQPGRGRHDLHLVFEGLQHERVAQGEAGVGEGLAIIRMTPRFNPDVNNYWMCDIGRFDYHWVEGETRLRRPMMRRGATLEAASWHDVEPRLRDRIQEAGAADPASVRFLASAHASTEELFVLKQVVDGLLGSNGAKSVSIAWTRHEKPQPAGTKFKVPATNAPNVNGARALGYDVGAGNDGLPDLKALRAAVEGGHVKAMYVLDPGPVGSMGDLSWLAAARTSGTLPLLIVQGVLASALTEAADFVLPGTAYVEKDAIYTNDQGRVQAASRAIAPPGEALEDWQILVNLGRALGLTLAYESSTDVRRAIAAALPSGPYAQADQLAFTRPVPASSWLQASNPSERWKWDFLFQDLPPVKGHNVQTEDLPQQTAYIPLKPVG
jgi:NADH-quinone oxidoreductase subunit G